jgi:hypothetical protein
MSKTKKTGSGNCVFNHNGKFRVTFRYRGRQQHHGLYETFDEAKNVADLIKQGGDFEKPKGLAQARSKSGHIGVNWDKGKNKWVSFIYKNGKTIRLGRFNTIEEAIAARKAAENEA